MKPVNRFVLLLALLPLVDALAAEDQPIAVLTSPIPVQHLNSARVGNVRLLAWSNMPAVNGGEVRGVFLDAVTHQPVSDQFVLAQDGDTFNCLGGQTCRIENMSWATPVIQADKRNSQFLVSWLARLDPDTGSTKPDTSEVVGRMVRIGDDGQPSPGSLFRISNADNDSVAGRGAEESTFHESTAIAFNADDNEYAVLWMGTHVGESDPQPYVQRIAADGALLGASARVYGGLEASDAHPEIAYDAAQRRYVVVLSVYLSVDEDRSLFGAALNADLSVAAPMQQLIASPSNFPAESRTHALDNGHVLLLYADGPGLAVKTLRIASGGADTSFGVTPAGSLDIVNASPAYALQYPVIVALPEFSAVAAIFTDTFNDGDGLIATGHVRVRVIDTSTEPDTQPALGPLHDIRSYVSPALGNESAWDKLITAGAVNAHRLVLFARAPDDDHVIEALEFDVIRNDLAVAPGDDVNAAPGNMITVAFEVTNLGATDIPALSAQPQTDAIVEFDLPEGFAPQSITGCEPLPGSTRCVLSEPLAADTTRSITLTLDTSATASLTEKKDYEVRVSVLPAHPEYSADDNVAAVRVRLTPKQPGDPNDPTSPSGSGGGGGAFGFALLALVPWLRRRMQ